MDTEKKEDKSERLIKSRKELLVFIANVIIFYVGTACFSMLAPFFGPEAKKKGLNDFTIGLIYGFVTLVNALISPVVGRYIPKFGPKLVLIVGSFLEGSSQLAFGFVDKLPDGNIFIVFCFLIQAIGAFGTACSNTAILAIISVTFTDNVSRVFGILEAFTGLGFTSGPAIGGLLYKVGGFKLPFIVLGSVCLLGLLVIYFLLPNDIAYTGAEKNTKRDRITTTKLLKIPGILINCTISIVASTVFSFPDPVLANYLKSVTNNEISVTNIALCFVMISGVYSICAPFVGWITNGKIWGRYVILFSYVLLFISFLLMGPSPLLQPALPKNLSLLLTALVIYAFGSAPSYIPILADMQNYGKQSGYPDDLAMNSLISGIWGSCISVGNIIGPALAGGLTSALSFEWATTIVAGIVAFETVIVVIFTVNEKLQSRNIVRSNEEEAISLLKG